MIEDSLFVSYEAIDEESSLLPPREKERFHTLKTSVGAGVTAYGATKALKHGIKLVKAVKGRNPLSAGANAASMVAHGLLAKKAGKYTKDRLCD